MSTPVGPYTPVVRSGDLVFSSGQVGIAGGALVEGGVRAELTQAMENLATVLAQEGATLDDVVKTTVFLTDMGDYALMNEVYTAALGDHRPARSAVAVAALPIGACVEIEAVAFAPGEPLIWHHDAMIGVVIIVVVLLVAIPVGVLMSGGIGAAVIGWVLRNDVDSRNQDSELLDLNG